MVNAEEFGQRLKRVMDYYQVSAATFADVIGVQRSSISHLLSGRNKPSLDFVLKVLDHYKGVELYWLLNGKGKFPKQEHSPTSPADKSNSVSEFKDNKVIDRIIIFYSDGTFENYIP